MELQIKFYKEIPSVSFVSKDKSSKLFQLIVNDGSPQRRQEVSTRYLTQMDYAFKGVTNNADNFIESLYVNIENLGLNVTKTGSHIQNNSNDLKDSKYKTIVYDIAPGIVSENMYVTQGGSAFEATNITVDTEFVREMIDTHMNFDIIQCEDNMQDINIVLLMAIVEKHIPDYSLQWNGLTRKFQLCNKRRGATIYSNITANDTYTFFRLLGMILDKGKHNGVFYIRGENYRLHILDAILEMLELIYKDKYVVFLYNSYTPKIINRKTLGGVSKEIIELPNYLIMK